LSPWRMEIVKTPTGATVINDAYNANDQSMAAALRSLASIAGRRKVAVLGTMAELGDYAASAHRSIAALARELGIDTVIAVNEPLYSDVDSNVDSVPAALETLASLDLVDGDVVLVKGSRMAGLESLAAALTASRGNLDAGLQQKEPR
jgi:UDP-N-acetylmuramoyl-tripeptide--D-alanyl-D-alanine ligase